MAGLIGLFGSRALAWLVLGGGGLFVALSLWQGAKMRGASNEALKWRSAVQEQRQDNRDRNFNVNSGSIAEQGTLQEQEARIRDKWKSMKTPEAK